MKRSRSPDEAEVETVTITPSKKRVRLDTPDTLKYFQTRPKNPNYRAGVDAVLDSIISQRLAPRGSSLYTEDYRLSNYMVSSIIVRWDADGHRVNHLCWGGKKMGYKKITKKDRENADWGKGVTLVPKVFPVLEFLGQIHHTFTSPWSFPACVMFHGNTTCLLFETGKVVTVGGEIYRRCTQWD